MSEIEFLIGDGTLMGSDAYFQAVTEGMIDPSISLAEFNSRSKHKKIEIKTLKEEEMLYEEAAESFRNVFTLLKNPEKRKEILIKWFGNESL